MRRIGPHYQSDTVPGWHEPLKELLPNTYVKFVENVAMAPEIKAANPNCKVIYRPWREQFNHFSLDPYTTKLRATNFIESWLDETFLDHARYIDVVEDLNEYWSNAHSTNERNARILWVKSLLEVWEDFSPMPAVGHLKWCLGNAAVGNDLPLEVARLAYQSGNYLGYHGYIAVYGPDPSMAYPEVTLAQLTGNAIRSNFRDPDIPNLPYQVPIDLDLDEYIYDHIDSFNFAPNVGEPSPDEFIWSSGRILHIDDTVYKPNGVYPKILITEGGAVRDASGSGLFMPMDGWRHPLVCDGSVTRYQEFLGTFMQKAGAWNKRNNDRLLSYNLFTTGSFDWPHFEIKGELTDIFRFAVSLPDDYDSPPAPEPDPKPIPITPMALGVDVSRWQGTVDWTRMYEQDIRFAYIKISEGYSWRDPRSTQNAQNAKANHILTGAYHFMLPDLSLMRQVENFTQAIADIEKQAGALNLPPAIDIEVKPTNPELLRINLNLFVSELYKITGQVPILYTSPGYYKQYLANMEWTTQPLLWLAHWSVDNPTTPEDYKSLGWDFWQFTNKANGKDYGCESPTLDLNYYIGSEQELLDEYQTHQPQPDPDPEPVPVSSATNKIGYHLGSGGNPTGIGQHMRDLHNAGKRVILKCADHYGPLTELTALLDKPDSPDHIGIFRLSVQRPFFNPDVPDYSVDPEMAAKKYIAQTLKYLPPEFDKRIWLELTNEVDQNNFGWLALFAGNCCDILLPQGYKLSFFGWSSGEPEPSDWEIASVFRFLQRASANPRIALSLHEYSYNNLSLRHSKPHDYPYQINRVHQLYRICQRHNMPMPEVHISEAGWGRDGVPYNIHELVDDVRWLANVYAAYPKVTAATLWYLGSGYGDIANQLQPSIEPVTHMLLDWQPNPVAIPQLDEDVDPPPPPEPPPPPRTGDKPRIDWPSTYHVIPQNATLSRALEIYKMAWLDDHATAGGSADHACYGPHLSYVRAIFYDIPLNERQEYFDWAAYWYPNANVFFAGREKQPSLISRLAHGIQFALSAKSATR